ncbi:aldehyde dehydrogenase (NADP(+)) [Muricauda sp. CAU 1633]|nr:aldehyde dehydrogenase (NADP(+)) [Muricauda sp. CAU 1633]
MKSTQLTGDNYIGFKKSGKGNSVFQAVSPNDGVALPVEFKRATDEEFEEALSLAEEAFPIYRSISNEKRANFLDRIADEIMALGDVLVERCALESGLGTQRITGERGRTCNQLKLFAQLLRDGNWVDARIDKSNPDRQPVPKPDVRRMLIPVGPVAVFGASNFPLAFSTAGGDTASALAAGCPVVVKSHSSHPGTNALVSFAINKAAQETGMPEGVFSSIYLSHEYSVKLVEHPIIKSVGFTGSRSVGMTLFKAAINRPEPISVFAEMSSINPVVLLENAIKAKTEQLAESLVQSVTLGVGQFCTNPGLVLLIKGETSQKFLQTFSKSLEKAAPGVMLNKNIASSYRNGVESLQKNGQATLLAESAVKGKELNTMGSPAAFTVSGTHFLQDNAFSDEVFGPASVFVLCNDHAQQLKVLESFEGQLTATVHAEKGDEQALPSIIELITQKAGRVIYGGFPTGVEVCHSMQHGGPFPATTFANSTSVGTDAIRRFVRPVAYQDFPNDFLPNELKNDNPLQLLRLVDGNWTKDKI